MGHWKNEIQLTPMTFELLFEKGKIQSNYFTFFVKLLKRARSVTKSSISFAPTQSSAVFIVKHV